MKSALLLAAAASVERSSLTHENWLEHVKPEHTSIMIMAKAPHCDHCKRMIPAWNDLRDEYSHSDSALVAEIDCIGPGRELCEDLGVKGYPTVKYGNPHKPYELQTYTGARDFDSLRHFAENHMHATCGPNNLEVCDKLKKSQIARFQAMEDETLESFIKLKQDEVKVLTEDHTKWTEILKKELQDFRAKEDIKTNIIKGSHDLEIANKVHKFREYHEKK